MRKFHFQTDNFYHIYNRGVDKRLVFNDKDDYFNFLIRLRDFNNDSVFEKRILALKEPSSLIAKELGSLPHQVDIIAYCLNSNHYHLLVKQLSGKGIEKFMHKIGTGYTNYFNKKYQRSGSLFQGKFKAVHIETDEQLLYTSCYINGNAEIHKISQAAKWPWASYPDYIGRREGTLINKAIILKDFKNTEEYKKLTETIIKESGDRKEEVKKYLLEE